LSRVAIVTDSASDLTPEQAASAGITVVPLILTFGDREFRPGRDINAEEFWRELTAPGAPFPKTAAASPGAFKDAFEAELSAGADELVFVGVGSKLSATLGSAKVAREMLPDRPIHLVDSESACMGEGLLALLAAEKVKAGASASEVVRALEELRNRIKLFVVLETLEYLKRGGRISPARAAIGSVLSVKPIITVEDGVVETVDRPRTRGRARERLLELITERKPTRVVILDCQSPDIDAFARDVATATNIPLDQLPINLVGASVGPHVGPGAYGAVVLTS